MTQPTTFSPTTHDVPRRQTPIDPAAQATPQVHADDLGLNETVNRTVAALLRTGQITSVSMMANRPATTEAAAIVRRHPEVSTHLHLNLTEGDPLSLPDRPRGSTGGALFRGLPLMLSGLLRGSVDPDVVEAELNAQLDRLLDLGVAVGGIDSHHHVHAFAPVGEVVDRVASERGIHQIRGYDQMRTYTAWGGVKKALFTFGARGTGWRWTRSLSLGPAWRSGDAGQPFAVASWERLGPRAARDVSTIVCHPGNTCDAPASLELPPLTTQHHRRP